jgi:hypothetical protein
MAVLRVYRSIEVPPLRFDPVTDDGTAESPGNFDAENRTVVFYTKKTVGYFYRVDSPEPLDFPVAEILEEYGGGEEFLEPRIRLRDGSPVVIVENLGIGYYDFRVFPFPPGSSVGCGCAGEDEEGCACGRGKKSRDSRSSANHLFLDEPIHDFSSVNHLGGIYKYGGREFPAP